MKRAEQNLNNFLIFFNLTFQEGFAILLQPRLGANLRPKNHVRGVRFFFLSLSVFGSREKVIQEERSRKRERERHRLWAELRHRVLVTQLCHLLFLFLLFLPFLHFPTWNWTGPQLLFFFLLTALACSVESQSNCEHTNRKGFFVSLVRNLFTSKEIPLQARICTSTRVLKSHR